MGLRENFNRNPLYFMVKTMVSGEDFPFLAIDPRNAFGFWDAGTDDGHCLVPTASFFNHSCEPNCLWVMLCLKCFEVF